MAVLSTYTRGAACIGAVLAVTSVAACGGAAPRSGTEGAVAAAVTVDVSTLDPTAQYSANATGTFGNIFDSLTAISPDGKLQPQLATEWTTEDGARTWDFKLRPGVKFSNGEKLDAADVVFTFQHMLKDEKSPYSGVLSTLDSVTKVDDLTVRFVHKSPRADFPRLANLFFVLPDVTYPKLGAKFASAPVGSGPYTVTSWKRDDTLKLKRNDTYWGKRPSVASAEIRIVPSISAAASALRAGDVDIVPALAPEQMSSLSKAPGIKVATSATNRVAYLGYNFAQGALAEPELRRAIDIALDRPAMVKLLDGQAEPVGQPVAPASFGYAADVKAPERDLAEAKKLVEQSGYDGKAIPLTFPGDRFPAAGNLAQMIAGQLQAAGVKVELRPMKYTSFLPLWFDARKKLPGIYLSTYGPSSMDSSVVIQEFLANATRTAFADKTVDTLNKNQLGSTDDARRAQDIAGIWTASAQQAPYSWLYYEKQAAGVREGIDWTPRADTAVRFADIR